METSVFSDLIADHLDIIRGTKGSGKSALYQLVANFLSDHLLTDRRTVIIKAVETKGDPVFQQFQGDFDQFSETDFENFWRVYFISLITSQFVSEDRFSHLMASAKAELRAFKKLAKEQNFPVKETKFSIVSLVAWAVSKVPRIKRVEAGVTPEATPQVAVEFAQAGEGAPASAPIPLFVSALHDQLIALLQRSGVRLWIMLDRLDEAFPRRSAVERKALRALLRTTQAFKSDIVRLKIFLRDDIFDSVTDDAIGFVALSHVMSRCSPVLRWSKEQILQLVTNRIFSSETLRNFFGVEQRKLRLDERYRAEAFYKIFPRTLRAGSRQSSTLDWIYKHCEDSNGVVTPRDVIDLINAAKHKQWEMFQTHRGGTAVSLLSTQAVLQGHMEMSKKKKETYLKAEFKHFWPMIKRFENQKAEHDDASLRALLGKDYIRLQDLRSIGFLKENPAAGTHSIPFLYRPGLSIRQGKSIGRNDRKS
ncbi:MAG TPA: hypothetical protein VGQ36_09025 [Thermoanaerobaculia bacterium]|nr:hypothetical protein [Thermoanaerobaculia bacterium]